MTQEQQVPELEMFYLILLKRGDNPWADDAPKEDIMALQEAHMGNIRKLAEAGHMAIAGPFVNADDGLRGAFLLRAESLEHAIELTQSDPAVQAGKLKMDVIQWAIPKGTIPELPTA